VKGHEALCGFEGRRVWFVARLTLLLWAIGWVVGCEADGVPPEPRSPWTVSVLHGGASSAAGPAVLSACRADGSHCAPLEVGARLAADGMITSTPGVDASLKLGPATILALLGQVEVGLSDGAPRQLEARRGRIVLAQDGLTAGSPGTASAVSLGVSLAAGSFTVDPATAMTVAMQAHGPERGALTVHRGAITFRPAVGEPVVVPTGHTLRIVADRAPDLRSATTGRLAAQESVGAELRIDGKADAAERRGFGTMTARLPRTSTVIEGVRLVSHHVRVVVHDGFARTEIEEVFHNDTDRVLEGRYAFALPPDASISRVALWVGDELVEGEVVERRRAERIFKGIVDAPVLPRDPALLEWVSGGRFSLTVFPIPARQGRRVLLAYDQALAQRGGVTRYVYPMSLGAERSTPIDELSFELQASDSRAAFSDVQVPHYAAEVEQGADVKLRFNARHFAPAADMVVSLATEPRTEAQLSAYVPVAGGGAEVTSPAAAAAGGDRGYFALRLVAVPPADKPAPAFVRRDRAIIIDRSHSQSAETLRGALAMAAALIRQLDPDERFVLLACDSACESYPREGLATARAAALESAVAWLARHTPGGSSDLAGALLAAARRLEPNGAGQIVYLGDGAPTSGELSAAKITTRVGEVMRARHVDLRLLGVGRAVDEVVLGGLARQLGASYERVANGDPWSQRSAEIARGLRQPLVTGATLDLPDGFVAVHPRTLPNLRLGQELVVVGKLTARASGTVTLSGQLGEQPYRNRQPIRWTTGSRQQNPLVPRLWALARLADLQASGDGAAARGEIVALSQEHSVMSRYTSFLVLENDAMYRELGIERRRGGTPMPRLGLDGGAFAGTASAGQMAAGLADLDVATVGALRRRGRPPRASSGGFAGGGLAGIGNGSAGSVGSVAAVGGSGGGQVAGAGRAKRVAGVRGSAMVGGAGVGGGVVANARAVVSRMRGRFRRCYQLGLRQDPDLQGTVTLTAKIGPNGEVVSVGGGSAALTPIVPCLKAVVSAGAFTPPDGGGAAIAIPITFVRQDGSSSSTARRSNRARTDWSVPPLPVQRVRRHRSAYELTATHWPGTEAWREAGAAQVAKLEKALAEDDRRRGRHARLVRGLLRHGRFDRALAAARRFAALDPDLDLAQELLAQAAVVNGEPRLALTALDSQTETRPRDVPAHLRAARAFEGRGDERRACAHWRAAAELQPDDEGTVLEALRCRARVLDDGSAALREARARQATHEPSRLLVARLEQGTAPRHQFDSGRPGLFEAKLSCAAGDACPTLAVVTPAGQVRSPWTPSAARASRQSVSFGTVPGGTYRTLLLGGKTGVQAELVLRVGSSTRRFATSGGGTRTVAATRVAYD